MNKDGIATDRATIDGAAAGRNTFRQPDFYTVDDGSAPDYQARPGHARGVPRRLQPHEHGQPVDDRDHLSGERTDGLRHTQRLHDDPTHATAFGPVRLLGPPGAHFSPSTTKSSEE